MPRLPKDPAIRQRRNKASTRATLQIAGEGRKRAPCLPQQAIDATGKAQEWHLLTRAWWRDCWHSPMAAQWLEADVHGLYRLAVLVNAFWRRPSGRLSSEIRANQQLYGLSPLDRRRLEWIVERAEEEKKRRVERPAAGIEDPRRFLQVVS